MKLLKIVLLSCLILSSACNHGQTLEQRNIDNYNRLKVEFDSSLTAHFPSAIVYDNGQQNFIISYTSEAKNQIGLFFYEYKVDLNRLDSIESDINNTSVVGKYNAHDSCLLIVNRFETLSSAENYTKPSITDSSLIERNCYENMFPVPNFANYKDDEITSFGLDKTFTIYVFEAKPGKRFKKYDLKPFDDMPQKWENGYSKGIAISEKNRTVIYWGIIW